MSDRDGGGDAPAAIAVEDRTKRFGSGADAVTAVGYLALGYPVFQRATRRAGWLGVLGDY